MKLYSYQLDSLKKMHNGCVLNGGVGTGKSITSVAYYYILCGGSWDWLNGHDYVRMASPKDLYIITTAQKRDIGEWVEEIIPFGLNTDPKLSLYSTKVIIDSWNNIKKYKDVNGAFFIFDEQRVTGSGTWVKSFLDISRKNNWILLSATPGDTWSDYIPLFVANGFFRNKTEFAKQHIVWNPHTPYRKVDRYINTGILIKYKDYILVDMDCARKTHQNHYDISVVYDKEKYKSLLKDRFNYDTGEPIKNAAELCYQLRKIVNSDPSRQIELISILEDHPKAIIFYNYDYELDILKSVLTLNDIPFGEYNGHRHDALPEGTSWVYLVNYIAGNAGWNCITTDTIIFWSQNYSYKIMVQSSGRIDRVNTPFKELYYYHFKSKSGIDLAISKALKNKKNFNENNFGGY